MDGTQDKATRRSVVVPLWQDRPSDEALGVAALADTLGYTGLWIGEMATFDAFALATAIGRESSLEITVGPLAVGIRTSVNMAVGIASVTSLIGRRARLAIGASSPYVVSRWHGRPWTRTADHLAETARIVRELLGGGRTDHAGELETSHGYRLRLAPPGADLTIAGFGPRALQVAAHHADRVVLNMVTTGTVERIRSELDRLSASPPTLAVWLSAALNPSPAERAQLASARVGYVSAPGYSGMLTEAGFGDLVAYAGTRPSPAELVAAMPPEMDDVVGIAGTSTHLEERIAQYRAAGADEVCLVPTTANGDDGRATLEALAPTD